MNRLITAVAATAASAFLLSAATPSYAQAGGGYRLTPAAAVSVSTVVTGDSTLWKCTDSSCVASKATSRPAIVCAQAAKKVGKLASFTANGVTFSDEDLAKCNEKAR